MRWTAETRAQLATALNEATLLAVDFDPDRRTLVVTFAVLALPGLSPAQEPTNVRFVLLSVSRVAASLRKGKGDDRRAEVVPFLAERLAEVVRSFGGQPIKDWEFFDAHDHDFASWSNRLSLDWRGGRGSDRDRHTLTLFQDGIGQHLDLRIWFEKLEILDPTGRTIDINSFCADGERSWCALHKGDPATQGRGIAPLRPTDGSHAVSADEPWTRRDVWLGVQFILVGLMVTAFAYLSMRNGLSVLIWGTGWLLGPLLLLLGGNGLWRSLCAKH